MCLNIESASKSSGFKIFRVLFTKKPVYKLKFFKEFLNFLIERIFYNKFCLTFFLCRKIRRAVVIIKRASVNEDKQNLINKNIY